MGRLEPQTESPLLLILLIPFNLSKSFSPICDGGLGVVW